MTEKTLRCRYCGEPCDPSEMCDYQGLLLCDGCADTDTPEVVAEIIRLRDALTWYADATHYLSRWPVKTEVAEDGGDIARAALAPQSAPAPESAQDAPRIAQDAPQGTKSTNTLSVPIAGATGDSGAKTQGGQR